jgi:hypothetical protein
MSCDKNAPGKNETFFCQINGKAFRPDKDTHPIGGIGTNPINVYWYPDKKSFGVLAVNLPISVGFNIHYSGSNPTKGEYILSKDFAENVGLFTPNNDDINPEDLNSISGKLIVSEFGNNRISGTFEFTCKSKDGTLYKITKGQFNNVEF